MGNQNRTEQNKNKNEGERYENLTTTKCSLTWFWLPYTLCPCCPWFWGLYWFWFCWYWRSRCEDHSWDDVVHSTVEMRYTVLENRQSSVVRASIHAGSHNRNGWQRYTVTHITHTSTSSSRQTITVHKPQGVASTSTTRDRLTTLKYNSLIQTA